MVGERGFRKAALDGIDITESIDNLSYGSWFMATGQRYGSVGVVLGTREINFRSGDVRQLPWEHDCPVGPYHFGPERRTRDVTGAIREECDLFQYWSHHPGGAHFLFADGSVHFLAYGADAVLPQLASRAGGGVGTPPR